MDFGNFCRNHQPGHFEQFVCAHILVTDDRIRFGWVAQSRIGIGGEFGLGTKSRDKLVMFPGKQVVVKTQAHCPVVGKCGRFLTRPLRDDRVGLGESWQVAELFALAKTFARRN